MKLLSPLALGLVASLASCNANPETSTHDHWNVKGVAPSFTRSMLGYDADREGRYIEYQYRNKKAINLTLMRHLMNENPDNPFEAENTTFYDPRPPHSILPRPWYYINWEGLAMGGILLGATGAFVPIPVDSVIGTLSEGGGDEFAEGIERTLTTEKKTVAASYLHQAIGLDVQAEPRD
jgi:hypothetical protein